MSISVKLSYDVASLICEIYDNDLENRERSSYPSKYYKKFKAFTDLMGTFINKIKKKLIDKKGEKSFKMSFKYYEAYFLATYINDSLMYFDKESYNRAILLNLFLKIDEKL